MKPPERIETERLVLRLPVPADAEAIFSSYAQDGEVTRYMIWSPHKNIEETRRFVVGCIAEWEGVARFPYVITIKESGALVGMIEIRLENFRADVGYLLAREHWGKGLMSEALSTIVEWALRQESIYRVWALCDADNAASARVLEKAGMQREGLLRRRMIHPNLSREPRDCYSYAITK